MEFDFIDQEELDEIIQELRELAKHNANVTADRLADAMEDCQGQTVLHLNI